jgi:hypothetical protein
MPTHAFSFYISLAASHLDNSSNSPSANTSATGTSRLLVATPLLLAAVYYLFSPFFVQQARQRLIDYLEKVEREWEGPRDGLPPHLEPQAIGANTDWIIDAPQMVPTLLLPLAGAVFAFNDNGVSGIILAFATVIICAATLWIYTRSPVEYRAVRMIWHKYTVVSTLGIVLNLLVAGILLSGLN